MAAAGEPRPAGTIRSGWLCTGDKAPACPMALRGRTRSAPFKRCCQNQSADAAEASCGVWSCIPAQRCRCSFLLRSCAGSLNEGLHKCHRGLIFFGVSYCLTDLIKATFGCQRP